MPVQLWKRVQVNLRQLYWCLDVTCLLQCSNQRNSLMYYFKMHFCVFLSFLINVLLNVFCVLKNMQTPKINLGRSVSKSKAPCQRRQFSSYGFHSKSPASQVRPHSPQEDWMKFSRIALNVFLSGLNNYVNGMDWNSIDILANGLNK